MRLIEKIRQQYPSPIAAPAFTRQFTEDDYCVLGACLLYYACKSLSGLYRAFPDNMSAAQALQEINPFLSNTLARELAQKCIEANDNEDMESAWTFLEQALNIPSKSIL